MINIRLTLLFPIACLAQSTATNPLTFDAASVKPAVVPPGVTVSGTSITSTRREDFLRMRNTGGPGTNDPGRIHYPLASLKMLLSRAYDSYFEIKGPGYLDTEVVQIDATMPPDTTKEQFKEMLRSLIVDRFKLKYHVDAKEVAGYALVAAKGGPKLKESIDAAASQVANEEAPQSSPRPRVIGPDGFAIMPPGAKFGIAMASDNRARITSHGKTIDKLVQALGNILKSQVKDATGLTAKYDYTLTYAGGANPDGPFAQHLEPATPAEPSGLPDIFSALQSQLGLKLEPKKVAVEILVVDHMEKTPAEN
jgi:uncharacterized protein (TIGR03435 family)